MAEEKPYFRLTKADGLLRLEASIDMKLDVKVADSTPVDELMAMAHSHISASLAEAMLVAAGTFTKEQG